MITRSDLEFFQHFGAFVLIQLTKFGQNSKRLRIFWFSPQDDKAVDDRGAQHSHPDSTYPQWSSSSSFSSKSSFRPSSSSASGGVVGSTARNDRTSALKAAFQVFIFHLSLFLARGRDGGFTVSALDSGASGPGSSPVVFLGKTLHSHSASLHPGV